MESFTPILTAIWLGILTSISPCPLATNIAAVAYIGRRAGGGGAVAWSGLLYTAGRALVYVVLAAVLVAGVLSVPEVSMWLQRNMNKLLGPILILVGMFLLELISIPRPSGSMGAAVQRQAEHLGIWGALLLGVVFALSFCPVSAALFFGSLLPTAIKVESRLLIPALYGIGTALPVLVFAGILTFSASSLGRVFERVQSIEKWMRRATGLLFILIGVYFCLRYIFGVI